MGRQPKELRLEELLTTLSALWEVQRQVLLALEPNTNGPID